MKRNKYTLEFRPHSARLSDSSIANLAFAWSKHTGESPFFWNACPAFSAFCGEQAVAVAYLVAPSPPPETGAIIDGLVTNPECPRDMRVQAIEFLTERIGDWADANGLEVLSTKTATEMDRVLSEEIRSERATNRR